MRLFIPRQPPPARPNFARRMMALAVLAGTALVLASPLAAPLAWGQVTTNDTALQGLQPAPPGPPAKAPGTVAPVPGAAAPSAATTPAAGTKPAPRHAPLRTATPHKTSTHPATKTAPAAKLPAVPAAPPANPVILPPPVALPVHKRPPPPPVPIKADAKGEVSPIANGNRLVFGPGSADLNPTMNDAIQTLAARARADATLGITITAWAPGTQEDPSTPRRLSLDRALAVRAMLINAGIPSERITAVARGFTGIEAGPPDRLDLTAAPPRATPAGKPAPPPLATPGAPAPAGAKP